MTWRCCITVGRYPNSDTPTGTTWPISSTFGGRRTSATATGGPNVSPICPTPPRFRCPRPPGMRLGIGTAPLGTLCVVRRGAGTGSTRPPATRYLTALTVEASPRRWCWPRRSPRLSPAGRLTHVSCSTCPCSVGNHCIATFPSWSGTSRPRCCSTWISPTPTPRRNALPRCRSRCIRPPPTPHTRGCRCCATSAATAAPKCSHR